MSDTSETNSVLPNPPAPLTPEERARITMEERNNEITALSLALRRAVSSISSKLPSSVRMIVDPYLNTITPARRHERDTRFSVSVRRHVRIPSRCASPGSKYDILIFHIGDTVMCYYDACREMTARSVVVLRQRVAHIQEIERRGLDTFKVVGQVSAGFYLENPTKETNGVSDKT